MVVESCGGGTGRHVLDLSEGLLERGCDVHLIYSPRSSRFVLPEAIRPSAIAIKHAVAPMHQGYSFQRPSLRCGLSVVTSGNTALST